VVQNFRCRPQHTSSNVDSIHMALSSPYFIHRCLAPCRAHHPTSSTGALRLAALITLLHPQVPCALPRRDSLLRSGIRLLPILVSAGPKVSAISGLLLCFRFCLSVLRAPVSISYVRLRSALAVPRGRLLCSILPLQRLGAEQLDVKEEGGVGRDRRG
jgi:hypothetical protein